MKLIFIYTNLFLATYYKIASRKVVGNPFSPIYISNLASSEEGKKEKEQTDHLKVNNDVTLF